MMICFLYPSPSLSEGLQKLNGISRSQQIKLGLNKKWLNQSLRARVAYEFSLNILNYGLINPVYSGDVIKIVGETNDLIAFDKPAKVHSHPLTYEESDNLLSGLYALKRGELLRVNQSHYDRGLIYRLDFETSGLILMAKSDEVYQRLRTDFSTLVKSKKYLALVEGVFPQPCELTHKIKPAGSKGSHMKEDSDGRDVHIFVKPLEKRENETLVEVILKEGARHQIRAQLSFAGYPIKGDELYGAQPSDRVYLHCLEYDLADWGTFRADPEFLDHTD